MLLRKHNFLILSNLFIKDIVGSLENVLLWTDALYIIVQTTRLISHKVENESVLYYKQW